MTSALQFLASCVPGKDICAVLAEIPDASIAPIGDARPINAASTVRKFRPRRYQCSPDREASRRRRRVLGSDGHLPPNVRQHFTESERAVLTIMAGEVKRHGVCDFPIDKIAALAGVCRTTVQNTIHWAARLGLIEVEYRKIPGSKKNKTNVVRIRSREWLDWIKRGPAHGFKMQTEFNFLPPKKNIDSKKEGLGGEQREYPRVGRILRVSG